MPTKDSPAGPGHRRTVSSTSTKDFLTAQAGDTHVASSMEQIQYSYAESSSTSNTKSSSRIITTVRRSIGSFPKKRADPSNLRAYGMISTPAERRLPTSTRYRDYTASRPTIEQIAMGLHTSRTPHLRPLNAGLPPTPQSRRAVLPPPPERSSLKQTSSSPATLAEDGPASASSSTLASSNPPASKALTAPMSSIKVRMARFLPRGRISSAPASVPSTSPSPRVSTDIQTPKKAVRFSVSSEA